jgi:hypothetical protein
MLIRTDTLVPWKGEPLSGLKHPKNIEKLWTVQELADVGLVVAIPLDIPPGHRRIGPISYNAAGQSFAATELIPPPTPAELDADDVKELNRIFSQRVLLKILYALAKDARPALTRPEFRAWIEGLS